VTGAANSVTGGHGSQINITAPSASAEDIEANRRQRKINQFFAAWLGSPGADGITGDEMAGILSPRQINYINSRLEQDGESFRLPQKR
jgi:hypothetical protein